MFCCIFLNVVEFRSGMLSSLESVWLSWILLFSFGRAGSEQPSLQGLFDSTTALIAFWGLYLMPIGSGGLSTLSGIWNIPQAADLQGISSFLLVLVRLHVVSSHDVTVSTWPRAGRPPLQTLFCTSISFPGLHPANARPFGLPEIWTLSGTGLSKLFHCSLWINLF